MNRLQVGFAYRGGFGCRLRSPGPIGPRVAGSTWRIAEETADADQFGVDGATLLNENRTVAISLRRELQKQRTEKKRVIMTGTPRFLRLGAEESPQHPLISDD